MSTASHRVRVCVGLLSCALALVPACSQNDSVAPPVTPPWRKWSGNPILVGGAPGSWDADGVSSPSVLSLLPNGFVMWYAGNGPSGGSIGLAWSDDGVAWIKDPRSPVFRPGPAGSWDAGGVADPCVFLDDAGYRMYYTCTNASGGRSIGLAVSSDGIDWQRVAENPVLIASPAGTAWDDEAVYTPWVLHLPSGYAMWYGALGTTGYRATGLAHSTDGVHWTRRASPVLDPQVLEALTFGPCVLQSGSTYRLWCVALHEAPGGSAYPGVIDYAQSSDGAEWSRNQLALSPGPPSEWDGGELRAVCVLDLGADMRMWYAGSDAGGASAIGLAMQP